MALHAYIINRLFVVVFVLIAVDACSVVPGSRINNQQVIFDRSQVLVYGRTSLVFDADNATQQQWGYEGHPAKEALFTVDCVLKQASGSTPLNASLTIRRVAPLNTCQRTTLTVNQTVILALRWSGTDGGWVFDDVDAPFSGAAYDANNASLSRAVRSGGDRVYAPAGGDVSRCSALLDLPYMGGASLNAPIKTLVIGLVALCMSPLIGYRVCWFCDL